MFSTDAGLLQGTVELLQVEEGSLYPALLPHDAEGLDQGGVLRLREQPAREVLPADDSGAARVRGAVGGLPAAVERGEPRGDGGGAGGLNDGRRRLRDIAASVEPGFQLHGLENRAEYERSGRKTTRTIAAGIAATTLSVLLLSAAGIYAMLSFTVWATDGRIMGNASDYELQGAFVVMPIVAAIVTVVGLVAALGPARRGLAVQPTEALREE